jgi:hypothetical protein
MPAFRMIPARLSSFATTAWRFGEKARPARRLSPPIVTAASPSYHQSGTLARILSDMLSFDARFASTTAEKP